MLWSACATRRLLGSLVRALNDSGIDTVYEGIETPEHHALAISEGATHLQGYFIHRPQVWRSREQP